MVRVPDPTVDGEVYWNVLRGSGMQVGGRTGGVIVTPQNTLEFL